MRKLTDINPFKKESMEKFNLLHSASPESRIKALFSAGGGSAFGGENYKKTAIKLLIVLLALLFLWKLAAFVPSGWRIFSDIDSNKFQAVFLNNNQTYFGHISEINESSLVLEKIYYFKASAGASSGQQLNLVRLRDEIYGPEDKIYISNNQVSYWQNLRDDSQVVKMIGQLEGK